MVPLEKFGVFLRLVPAFEQWTQRGRCIIENSGELAFLRFNIHPNVQTSVPSPQSSGPQAPAPMASVPQPLSSQPLPLPYAPSPSLPPKIICFETFPVHFYAAQPMLPQECYTGAGNVYRGFIKITESGKLCQNWNSQTPHKHKWTPEKYVLYYFNEPFFICLK